MNVHKKGVLICPLPGCDRSYSHPSSMRKHMKTHGAAAKGLPLPERMVDQYYSASYFNVMPNEPFRRRKKYNLKGSNNQADNQSSSNSDSDDQNVAPMTSSPNGNHMIPFAHMINRSGSDSGHETSGQPSPEHTIDQDYNGQFHLGFNMAVNPLVMATQRDAPCPPIVPASPWSVALTKSSYLSWPVNLSVLPPHVTSPGVLTYSDNSSSSRVDAN